MATVAHHIYSHYDPQERQDLEAETGQTEPDAADPWISEKAFGANERINKPPHFVPASTPYDAWHKPMHPKESTVMRPSQEVEGDVGGWYRSLTRRSDSTQPPSLAEEYLPSTSKAPISAPKTTMKRDKNNWFISRALQTEVSSRSGSSTPPQTLADILSRDPPPEPSKEPFVPPVFLTLGPDNRGFAMLQRSGWQEGEALGRTAPRRARSGLGFTPNDPFQSDEETRPKKRPRSLPRMKSEVKEVTVTIDDEIDVVRKVDVIDLTSDNDEDASDEEILDEGVRAGVNAEEDSTVRLEDTELDRDGFLDHNPRALITPLPTILKSDRLGIGLKAKRAGPYGESVKRVTHSQAALAVHVQRSEQIRQQKAVVGRGRRGFERMSKKEMQDRNDLLAYLKAD
ncbi:hypothetical protein BD410DRAFT_787646 [Rickenella mellea]|uniref:G-patch domain-containing protein n=1 Tax=Rickenella mellea TaxID=50990 RepID=A0A4Y7Q6M9_9AGAM|nr:hypothetical protein BD410DRAFT_787646 [Rickenella mellea]